MSPAELRRRRAAAQLLAGGDEPRGGAAKQPAGADERRHGAAKQPAGADERRHGAAKQPAGADERRHGAAKQPAGADDTRHGAAQQPAGADERRRGAAKQPAGADEARRTAGPRAAVAHLLAVQAQDLRAARLALRARGTASAAGDVDAALGDGSLLVAWLMRGTLHLVAREDFRWLHALTAGQIVASSPRRLGQLGVSEGVAERAVRLIERTLADDGPQTRARLAERLGAAGLPTEGQITPHLLALTAARGTIALGGDQAFVWLGPPGNPPDRIAALAELARRYLRGHGPATAADLATWSALGLRDVRGGLAAIASELEPHGDLFDLAGRPPAPVPPPRLLPAFDPYLLGWRDRSFAVDAEYSRRVHPGGGIVRATAIARGRAVATWTLRAGRVRLDPFAPLPQRVEAALRREAEHVERFVARPC
jgi:Winged helix DNA-binding domain